MRKKIVAGNWKMNLSPTEAEALAEEVAALPIADGVEVAIFPPMLYLQSCKVSAPNLKVGAQNAHPLDNGAYTGEVSMLQLQQSNVPAVLIGHSERRQLFQESDMFLKQKVDAAIANGIQPFFCCGEPLEIRESNQHLVYVKAQLEASLFHLSPEDFEKTVIAYEPIWAIGTGLTASVAQAEEMHAAIRSWIAAHYSDAIAANYSILYGGSCNPSNAAALFACANVDGGLIGGAALKISDFKQLVATETWTISN